MMHFTAMMVFVKTVETGSFTAAAAQLGLSSQAAGKHFRDLEDHFGTRLLNRTTRSQSLTEIGRFYYDQCKRAVTETDAAEAILAAQGGAFRGTLRISAPRDSDHADNQAAPQVRGGKWLDQS